MAQFVIANNVNTQLAAALPASGAGSTTVVLASSANLPTLNTATGQMMPLTLNDAATGAIYETVYVTAISGATLTVLRGQEGTSALNWNVGDFALCGPTAGTSGLTTMRTQYQASATFSSSQTLTAAIAGESIGFTGSSAATFSMPGQSTVPALTPTAVYNDGSAALTLTANGSDKFVVATGQVTSIVMQPGDDLSFYASATSGQWQATAGSALRQYEPLVIGAATASQHAVQFGQLTGIVGTTRNSKMQVGTASAAGTWACDWVIVETSAGLQYRLSNLSLNLNLATVGAGGMDTGAAPNAGYCGLYIIYNPTTATAALLAQTEGATALPEIYAGGNAPTGYTASALIGYFGTTAATPGLMKPHALQDRHVGIQAIQVLSTSTVAASPTLFSLSPAIPKKANRVFVTNILQGSTSSTGSGQLFTTSTSIGSANQGGFNSNSFASSSVELFIIAAQTAFYILGVSAGTITYTSTVDSFNF